MNAFRAIGRSLKGWAPILVLLLLAAGSVAHFGHHLLDPDCGSDPRPTHATCASCAALHGGITQATAAEVPVVSRPETQALPLAAETSPAASAPRLTSPRAPPQA